MNTVLKYCGIITENILMVPKTTVPIVTGSKVFLELGGLPYTTQCSIPILIPPKFGSYVN